MQALERAGLEAEDIDIIICATTTPDQIMPSTGALIQAQIGAMNAAGMDVFAACSGFLYGLTMVESMIRTGQIRYALVIGAEVLDQIRRLHRPLDLCYFRRRSRSSGARAGAGRQRNSRDKDHV